MLNRSTPNLDDRMPSYAITTWDESVVVESNGDAHKTIRVRAKALGDLQVVRTVQDCGWAQPAKHRRRVRVRTRLLLVNGAPQADPDTTLTWLRDGRLALLTHLPEPPKAGSEFEFAVEYRWPGMCAPLMRNRRPDVFSLEFATPVAYARYRVVLPRGYTAHLAPIGLDVNQDRLAFRTDREKGRPVFLFEGFDLPARESVGMLLNGRSGGDGHSAPRSASSALRLVMYRMDYGLSAIASA